jgi:CHAT domain-containing protein
VLPKNDAATPHLVLALPVVPHNPGIVHPTSFLTACAMTARQARMILCAVLVCALAGCKAAATAGLADALESAPGVAPRLSAASSFRACTELIPPGGTIPRASCPPRDPSGGQRRAQLANRAAQAGDDPAALHTLALLDLIDGDERGKALDRSITSLRRLAAVAGRPAPVLADLAGALIVRAERTQAPRDLLEASALAEEALRHDPKHPAALYNAALALDRFGLVDESARAWGAYLAVDARSGWADEARRRMQALRAAAVTRAPPAEDAPPAEYERYAAAEPQGARELGMERLLGAWSEALAAGDPGRAAHHLDRAAALGDALLRRSGGDASLADAVRAIRSASADPAALDALVRAHRDFSAGRVIFETLDFDSAAPRLAAAAASARTSPALRGWARLYYATALIQLRRKDEAEPLLVQAAAADTSRYPALAGRGRWLLGRIQAQGDSWDRGLEASSVSARLFARAGEAENEGVALATVAKARFVVGEADLAYATLHRALGRLRAYRASVRLHNLLSTGAEEAASDGLLGPAIFLQREGVAVALRSGEPLYAAEATLAHARLLASGEQRELARAEVDAAQRLIDRIPDRNAREWMQADLQRARAVALLQDDPRSATQALDSAAAFYTGVTVPLLTLPALVGAAEARIAAGDAAGAVRRLESAVRLLDQRRDSIRMEPRRAAVFNAARGVLDRLVMLKLADGPAGSADRVLRSPPGEVAVEYARVADTLLVWTVAGGRVDVFRTVLDTLRFTRTLATLEARLQGRAGEAEVRPALAALYDWLVRPVQARLGRMETPVVIIADGEIAAVPFPALYDARRGRYLVQDRPLRFAVSLREARRTFAAAPADGVLLVANPAFAPAEYPLLEPLPQAGAEVRAIAPRWPGAAVLEGAAATRAALGSGLARAGIVHFAGHAVFDDERPERSHLVLAPGAGRTPQGRITAAELAALDLRHVRLVVLSACRTVRGGNSRTSGFTGLSGALLAAGARGTVGSTWDVDDGSTAPLMAELHRALSAGGDGPAALRTAQLALLRSSDPALRSPAAWGAFRYSGR